MCIGPTHQGRGRYPVMETEKCSSRHSWSSHKADCFSLCGKLVGHLTVCGWHHTAVVVIKHRVNAVTSVWDNQMSDALLTWMIAESVEREQHMRTLLEESGASTGKKWTPVHWRWEFCWRRTGSCWWRHSSGRQKGCTTVPNPFVSTTVSNMLTGKARICSKAANKMLIRQKLNTLKSLVLECNLTVSVTLAALYCNLSDQSALVPHK